MELLLPKIKVESLNAAERKIYDRLISKPFGKKLAAAVYKTMKERKTQWNGVFYRGASYCGIGFFLDKYGRILVQSVYKGVAALPIIIKFSSDESEFIRWLAEETEQSISCYGERFTIHSITRARLMHYLSNKNSAIYDNETLNIIDGRQAGIPDKWFLAD